MKTNYSVEEDGKTLVAVRSFHATLEKVWQAWTDRELLDKWWGPLPYKAVTQSFDFSEGGHWRYYMEGPEGDRHNCLNTYRTIQVHESFTAEDAFCNNDGTVNTSLPVSYWTVEFSHVEGVTTIVVTTIYDSPEALAQVSEMGMKEGFDTGLNQLEALLAN